MGMADFYFYFLFLVFIFGRMGDPVTWWHYVVFVVV